MSVSHPWEIIQKTLERNQWGELNSASSLDTHRDTTHSTHCISSHSHFYICSLQRPEKWFLAPILKTQIHTTWPVHHLLGSERGRPAARECACDPHTQPCKPTASSVPPRETRMCVASSADMVTRFTLVWRHRRPLLISEALGLWLNHAFSPQKRSLFFLALSVSSSQSLTCRRLVPLQQGSKSQGPSLSLCITGAPLSTLRACHQESIK